MKSELGSKLQSLHNFLLISNSEESKNYISDLLSGETSRPEELFVQKFLNVDFWKELGFSDSELKFERPAGVSGRVEWTLKVDGKMIAIECKRPYFVKKNKEVKNELDGNDIDELKDQIGQYLLSHDFIIFTNGFHWFFYSRESYRAWLQKGSKKGNELNSYFKYINAEEIFDRKSPNFIKNILNRDTILEALSSLEHKSIRHILTDEFFVDLKVWIGFIDEMLKDTPSDVKARTTHLINKLIFVRTMEGVGVIPNGFLKAKWNEKKGIRNSTVNLIDQIDDELSEIYDTELFTSKYLEDKDGEVVLKNDQPQFNPLRAKNYAYKALPEDFISAILKPIDEINLKETGITKINIKGKSYYIRSLYWWKFELISADILGKAYETYLARERKKLGIFYTPNLMTEYLTNKTIDKLFDSKINFLEDECSKEKWDIKKIKEISNDIKEIRICDPSCGSGSFLIQSMRVIWKKYKKIENIIEESNKKLSTGKTTLDDFSTEKFGMLKHLEITFRIGDKQERIGTMILRHIYGNDKDEKAVDTAKLNIWLECLRLDPNSFRSEQLKGKRHVLPNLELNITSGDSLIGLDVEETDKAISSMRDTIKQIHKLKKQYTESFDKTAIANTATEYRKGLEGFIDHEFIDKIGLEKTEYLLKMLTPSHWSINHFDAFYDKEGQLKPKELRGFDGIIGNPPWEVLKPSIDEYFGAIYDETHENKFRKLTKDKKNNFVEESLKDIIISGNWDYYRKVIETQMEYFQKIKFFQHQVGEIDGKKTGSDINLYKLFIEQYYNLLKTDGCCGVVLPANFYSDLGSKGLRELIFNNCKVLSLYGFDNQKGIFEEIHRQFKFIMLTFTKGEKTRRFNSTFYLREIEKIPLLDADSAVYDLNLVKKTSPKALSLIECKNEKEVKIIEKLFIHPLLLDKKWNLKFTNEFHLTKHAPLFNTKKQGNVLYEGKMIHQFNHQLTEPRYWVEPKKAEFTLLPREEKKLIKNLPKQDIKKESDSVFPKIDLDYNHFRLVWRDISRSTDQRTMIATILPPNVFLGNTLNYIRPINFDGKKYSVSLDLTELTYLCGVLNSFIVDFVVRFRVSIHVNMFYVYELPVPKNPKEEYMKKIVDIAGGLICTTKEFDVLKKQLDIKANPKLDNERSELVVTLNAYVAKIYGLEKKDLEYILSTFPIVKDELKQKILSEFEKLNK